MASVSIIVPTYNRVVYLRELLSLIISSFDGRDYEIIVCDNASIDDTEEFVLSLACAELSYYRHVENRGVDYNFLFGLGKANKDYSWILSSDDTFDVSLLDKFFDFIDLGKPDLVLLDMLRCDKNLVPFATHNWFSDTSGFYDLHSEEDEFFFLRSNPLLGVYFGYISSLVFKTRSLRSIQFDEKFESSFFSFSYFAYQMILSGCSFGYFKEYFIFNRGYNDSVISQDLNLEIRIHKRHMVDIYGFINFHSLFKSKIKMAAAYSDLIKRNYSFYDVVKVVVFSDIQTLRNVIIPFFKEHKVRIRFYRFFVLFRFIFAFFYLIRLKYGKSKNILPRWVRGR